jgi:hypothetical protein
LQRRWGVVVLVAMFLAPVGAIAEAKPGPPAPDTPLNDELFPRGRQHFRRCWQLEHDYYALRDQMTHTGVVWRREQLAVQWEQVRDERRDSCLMGW